MRFWKGNAWKRTMLAGREGRRMIRAKGKRAKGRDLEFCQEQENFFKVKAKTMYLPISMKVKINEDVNRKRVQLINTLIH